MPCDYVLLDARRQWHISLWRTGTWLCLCLSRPSVVKDWDGHDPRHIVTRYLAVKAGIVLRARLAVGFQDSIMVGASVIHGIVIMGELSITLCSVLYLITLHSPPWGGWRTGGCRICWILVWSIGRRRLPLLVVLARPEFLASSSVSIWKCWFAVISSNWQCCGNSLVNPILR